MVIRFKYPFSDSDFDVPEAKQQPKKTDKATDRSQKSKEAAQKNGRDKQKSPSSRRNNGIDQPVKSSNRTKDDKDTNVEEPSKQPGPSRKPDLSKREGNLEKQEMKKLGVPSPLTYRNDESANDRNKPERKSYSSSDSRNFIKVKDTMELRIRLRCNCEGCINRVREAILKFKGVQRVAVKADKDMVKVIGSMERKELVSYLEEKLRRNLASLPIKDYDNVVDDSKKNEADGGPMADCSPGISTTVQRMCQRSRDDDGVMQSLESSLPREEQKVTSTVVLKIRQYCLEGCVQQTRKTVENFHGVESLEIDADESQVKVTGTMKVEELVSHLQKKLKREVVLVSVKKNDKEVTNNYRLLQHGKAIGGVASGGYGEKAEKVDKVVEKELYRVKNVPDDRDTRVPTVMKASLKSKAVSKDLDNLDELKNGNAELSCPQHNNSQYCSVGGKVHHLEKVVKVGEKGLYKEENVSGGRDARGHRDSKKSKTVSRVHPVNLDEQTNVKPDVSQSNTWSGTMQHLENSMEGKGQDKVTSLVTFGLYCDEEHLEQTRETAMNFEGMESAKIYASKGLIVMTGQVNHRKLLLYLKENLKCNGLVIPIQRNDVIGDGNKVLTNIFGVNHEQLKGDADAVRWSQKLKEDVVNFGGDGNRHKGADEVDMKVKEVATCGNVSGAWRKAKLGEAYYINVDSLYQQNYGVDSLFQWVSPCNHYVSPFSDEDAHSCSIM